jgi:hypothetical protein
MKFDKPRYEIIALAIDAIYTAIWPFINFANGAAGDSQGS